ncbi:alpha/beta hydrolase [Yinghuangia sp. YIM S09857]|uniref:alpha/beta hydrolase n=1 Tax=Yinghuangia sp. YIM S09857 TaxID=3436929 RepID=UPI003F536F3F
MLTPKDLADLDLSALESTAAAWEKLVQAMSGDESRCRRDVVAPLSTGTWVGKDAETALAHLNMFADQLEAARVEAAANASILRAAHTGLASCKADLMVVYGEAHAKGFTVKPDGGVGWQTDSDSQAASMKADATALADRIGRIVQRAVDSDAYAASTLLANVNWGGTKDAPMNSFNSGSRTAVGLAEGVNPAFIPKDPAAVPAWWANLTQEQRDVYLKLYPHEVGSTDGLPTSIRDQANRDFVNQRIAYLQSNPILGPKEQFESAAELTHLQKIRDQLAQNQNRPPTEQLLLIKIDGADQGKVVYSIGNPDTAKHVAVYVPGTGSTGGELHDLGRATNLQRASDRLTPDTAGDVATVVWVDYDAPDNIPAATQDHYSEAGAPRLDAYLDGARANGGPDQHVTVIGHSYGSTLIGDAARKGDGLAVDDIVVAGSPGMHVDSADDLNIDPRHVWAQEAQGDIVPNVGGPIHGGWDFSLSDGVDRVVPTQTDFGGNITTTDGSGHSDYWNEGSVSLDNQAKVVVGQYNNPDPSKRPVLEHGEMPRS